MEQYPVTAKTSMPAMLAAALAAAALCAAAVPHAQAAPDTPVDEAVSRLEKTYQAISDFRAAFIQETRQSSINRVEKGSGKVFFKKPGKMLWDYEAPEAQKIILDGKNVWFYRPEERQVMKNNYGVLPRSIVLDLLRGEVHLKKKFAVTAQSPDNDPASSIVLELVPRTHNPTVSRILLHIDPETWHITRTCLHDEFGNTTILDFSDITVNQGLKDSLFAFTPPPGVDVFEPPQPGRHPQQ
jgi:outer membrane lipoprotein carrier protein